MKKVIKIISVIITAMAIASLVLGIAGCSNHVNSISSPTSSTTSTVSTTTTPKVESTITTTITTLAVTSTTATPVVPSGTPITITGYITTEDDFAAKLGADTAAMIHMRMMAASGLGITRQKMDGTWEFYFFNGTISSGDKVNGTWTFNGTGSQLDAWNLVTTVANEAPTASVPVTVTGVLNGDTRTNPGMDADGLNFPVITVTSITQK